MDPTIGVEETEELLADPEEVSSGTPSALEKALAAGFASVLEAFQSKLAYDRFKEEQIGRLHDELQEHKKDLLARTLRPLIHGLIRLHDDLGRATEALAAKPLEELTAERFFKTLEGFGDDLVLLLERHGVHPFEAPGREFDPQRQTVARQVETAEPEQVGRVAERLRPGFEQGAALLQKERVAVYVAASTVVDALSAASPEDEEPAVEPQDFPPQPES